MKKILIIGSGGAGKSTLAKCLGKLLDLPVIHLDSLYWKKGWQQTEDESWLEIVQNCLNQDSWVMDGNYGGTLDTRLSAADTVIFLDLPTVVCLWRVIKRRIQYHNQSRPDMATGCVEKVDWEFLHWIMTYRQIRRPRIVEKLKSVENQSRVIMLSSSAAVKQFEHEITKSPS